MLLPSGFEWYWNNHLYRHRPGGYSDGMSSPQFTHVLPDCDPWGWAAPAAVAHDGGYHGAIDIWHPAVGDVAGYWKPIDLPKQSCDQMFKDLLREIADTTQHQMEADMFFIAVDKGGQSSYDQGHARAWNAPV